MSIRNRYSLVPQIYSTNIQNNDEKSWIYVVAIVIELMIIENKSFARLWFLLTIHEVV